MLKSFLLTRVCQVRLTQSTIKISTIGSLSTSVWFTDWPLSCGILVFLLLLDNKHACHSYRLQKRRSQWAWVMTPTKTLWRSSQTKGHLEKHITMNLCLIDFGLQWIQSSFLFNSSAYIGKEKVESHRVVQLWRGDAGTIWGIFFTCFLKAAFSSLSLYTMFFESLLVGISCAVTQQSLLSLRYFHVCTVGTFIMPTESTTCIWLNAFHNKRPLVFKP